jgi:hypothetical protein
MALPRSRFAAAALSVVMLSFAVSPGFAQSGGDTKPAEPPKQAQTPEATKAQERQKIAEAAKILNGGAGSAECLWLGTRLTALLWRNDVDTAFRHIDLYDRFGCPGPHIQAAFRCLARQGEPDTKGDIRVPAYACWVNPDQAAETPQPTSAPAAPAAQPAAPAPAAAPAEKR